ERGGSCFPGQDVIQIETDLSLDTIQRACATLELDGWIKRKKRPSVRGQWSSWTYQINLEKLIYQAAPCGSVDQAAPCGPDNADKAAPSGFTKPHHAVSPGRTKRLEPVLKPIKEPYARERATKTDRGAPRQRVAALGAPPEEGNAAGGLGPLCADF